MAQRLIQPRGMPHHGIQPGVRESLVDTCIVYRDRCLYVVTVPVIMRWQVHYLRRKILTDFSVSLSGVPSRQGNPYEDYESV
jgi:hypothetical protein